ncbi:hypothetical protein [Deinococcus sp.]|uniref:hypothetical protein n=1 Tax=Deinococcus sp. TaxID=47478 RepID=UPI003C7C67F9
MLLNILGHVHLTRQGTGAQHLASQTVAVSGKAAALLTYLCLEGQAHHREHLAELLWDTPDPLRNLRVELARLKRDGVAHFPERQPMLSFQCPLDLSGWLAAAGNLSESQLLPWLAALRGLPLSGLEDLGSRQFQQWLDGQRWSISEQVERTLGAAHLRFVREHRVGAAAHIQARAEQLGLRLDAPEAATMGQDWRCVWEEQRQLGDLMERASGQPQLVLLYGRSGSGKRSLIRQSVQESGWQAIQLQASAQRPLFQEALAQQLSHLLPGSWPRPARSGNADAALIHLASGLQQSGLNLVIAIHNAGQGLPWLPELARFLLDLPLPLMLVLSETSGQRMDAVQGRLSFVERHRSHRLDMAPLTTRMVLRAWQEQAGPGLPAGPGTPEAGAERVSQQAARHGGETYARATVLIQRSEGWPLLAQALHRQADPSVLPDNVRSALLGDLAMLPRTVRAALARLSLIHDRFTPELAELLLGPDGSQVAPQVLLHAVQHGVLVPSAAHEELTLPGLSHRSDDQTRYLQFAHEPLRIALAGSLTGLERQEIRQTLARHLLSGLAEESEFAPNASALGLYHARKAGLKALANQAAQQLDTRAGQATATVVAPARPPTDLSRAEPPPSLPNFRRELRTPNGYRVALDSGHLEIMRRGWYGPAPLLTLNAGEVPGGPWTLTARIDVFRGAPEGLTPPTPFALGLRVGTGPRLVYLPATPLAAGNGGREGAATDLLAEEGGQFGGLLPLGEWFTLRGVGRAGRLELSVRALDVALTVAEGRWDETVVLPAWPLSRFPLQPHAE